MIRWSFTLITIDNKGQLLKGKKTNTYGKRICGRGIFVPNKALTFSKKKL